MALRVPNLDDKRFAALVEEGRRLIPRVAPRWTDHNASDPGITFLELLAWRTDALCYRIGRVDDATVAAMMRLLGVEPLDAEPTRVLVEPDATAPRPDGRLLPAGTRVAAREDDPPYVLREDVFIVGPKLVGLSSERGALPVDHLAANAEPGLTYWPFGADGSAHALVLELGAETRVPVLALTISLFEEDLPAAAPAPAEQAWGPHPTRLVWELESEGTWVEVTTVRDETLGLVTSGRVELPIPARLRGRWRRLRVRLAAGASFDPIPRLESIALDVLPLHQLEIVVDEWKELGRGQPDRRHEPSKGPMLAAHDASGRFHIGDVIDMARLEATLAAGAGETAALARRLAAAGWSHDPRRDPGHRAFDLAAALDRVLDDPALARPLEAPTRTPRSNIRSANRAWLERVLPELVRPRRLVVSTVEDDGPRRWDEVADLSVAAPDDRSYQRIDGAVVFGNDVNGHTPRAWIRFDAYHVTLGRAGIVAKGRRWTLPDGEIPGWSGHNSQASTGGRDREGRHELEQRARAGYSSEHSMITAEDHAVQARLTPGARIARVRVLGAHDPRYPKAIARGNTTVAIASFRRAWSQQGSEAAASPGVVRAVQRHLEQHRAIGESIHVLAARVTPVVVSASVLVDARLDPERIRRDVEAALRTLLRPHGPPGSVESMAEAWPFGASVRRSTILATIDEVPGVLGVERIELGRAGRERSSGDLQLAPTELASFGGLEWQARASGGPR